MSSNRRSGLGPVRRWLDRNIFELGREMRLSYLPPLMVYMAAAVLLALALPFAAIFAVRLARMRTA